MTYVCIFRDSSGRVRYWHVRVRAADGLATVQVPLARSPGHLLGHIAQHRRVWRRLSTSARPAEDAATTPVAGRYSAEQRGYGWDRDTGARALVGGRHCRVERRSSAPRSTSCRRRINRPCQSVHRREYNSADVMFKLKIRKKRKSTAANRQGSSKGDLGRPLFKSLSPVPPPPKVHHADILTEVYAIGLSTGETTQTSRNRHERRIFRRPFYTDLDFADDV